MIEMQNKERNECLCPRTECPHHGDCKACALHHKERGDAVFCKSEKTSSPEPARPFPFGFFSPHQPERAPSDRGGCGRERGRGSRHGSGGCSGRGSRHGSGGCSGREGHNMGRHSRGRERNRSFGR